jgi:hypothetical protein
MLKTTVKQSYLTLDNGGNPFRVVIENGSRAVVWAYNHQRKRPYLSFAASQILIGEDTELGDHGNSIILQKSGDAASNEYYFVGDTIFKFRTVAPLIYLASPVGNSSVPYPWALDTAGFIYLMTEQVVLKTNFNPNSTPEQRHAIDPFSLYYGHAGHRSPAVFKAEHPVTKKIYDMRWMKDPNTMWNYAIQDPKDYPFVELGRDVYIATIQAYGNAAGLYRMNVLEEVAGRTI